MEVVRLSITTWTLVQCAAGFVSIFLHYYLKAKSRVNDSEQPLPTCVMVIPMYLPNEACIAKETIKHAAAQNVNRVHIVYNTSHDMPELESSLRDLAETLSSKECLVELTRVMDSTSKAANLNYALTVATEEHMMIYDADHRIQGDGCTALRKSLTSRPKLLGVSGVLGIRGRSCRTKFLDAMEWTNWILLLNMQRIFIGSYVFGGSNAIWYTHILRELRFSESLLLEDMDMTLRALCAHPSRNIACDLNVRSTELGVRDSRAWWNQRMRSMMGWEQLSCQRLPLILRRRFRLSMMWVFRYAGVVAASVTVSQFIRQFLTQALSSNWMHWWLDWIPVVSYTFLVISWLCVLKENLRRCMSILVFTALSSVVLYAFAIMNVIAIVRIAFSVCMNRKPLWIITVRADEHEEKPQV